MLDGRIDTQGTLTELRAQGVLEDIANSEEVKVQKDEQEAAAVTPNAEQIAAEVIGGDAPEAKKPRKLVKDEERQEGGVEWSVYNTYLKASYVRFVTALIACFTAACSSYWTWIILGLFIILFEVGSLF
jgi:hypothetical protein